MSGLWRIRRFWTGLRQKYYTASFAHQCQKVGCDLLVKGPFRLRNMGQVEIGDSCIIDSSKERPICLDVGNRAFLKMGNGVYLNEGVQIVCNIDVTIGDRCLIASDVVILDDDGHPMDWRMRHDHWPELPEDRLGAPIIIEDNVWIGTRAILLKGVTIGSGAVIGAGAVVTHDVPSFVVAGGVPAKVIRELYKGV
jgi:acetyltransferase-like isoleucine patch superfamily enzyme